jgi:hypothetical protein
MKQTTTIEPIELIDHSTMAGIHRNRNHRERLVGSAFIDFAYRESGNSVSHNRNP